MTQGLAGWVLKRLTVNKKTQNSEIFQCVKKVFATLLKQLLAKAPNVCAFLKAFF